MKCLGRIFLFVMIIFFIPNNLYANHIILNSPSYSLRQKTPIHLNGVIKKAALVDSKKLIKLPTINAIYANGNINLKIIGHRSDNKMIIHRKDCDLPNILVRNGTLYISRTACTDNCHPPKLTVKVYVNQLQKLEVSGYSCVNALNIADQCPLCLTVCGKGTVCLWGRTQLDRVNNLGKATVCIPQVCSDHVHILNTCAGTIKLCGRTNLLMIRAFQNSVTDVKCLPAQTALVQTGNSAVVYLQVCENLRAFAADTSNIYYFTTPMDVVKHNVGAGNIFQAY